MNRVVIAVHAAALLAPLAVGAYPGGTPSYQTDAAPFCAAFPNCRNSSTTPP